MQFYLSYAFLFAANYLSKLNPAKAGKWKKYFELKSTFYLAYVSEL